MSGKSFCAHWTGTYKGVDGAERCRACYALCTPDEAARQQKAAVAKKNKALPAAD